MIHSLLEREPELRASTRSIRPREAARHAPAEALPHARRRRWRRSGSRSSSSPARTRSWRSWPRTAARGRSRSSRFALARRSRSRLTTQQHTISVLVENEFGVLARVAGLFSGRGFNIESLSVAETLDPTVSRITLVTRGDDQVLEQIEKQLNKLDQRHQGDRLHRHRATSSASSCSSRWRPTSRRAAR